MADPITSYNRVPPPADPESSHAHLDGELTKLERTTASLISTMGTLETTYATIVDLDAEEAARIAADTAEVTARNTAITSAVATETTARTAADALKADKTYVDTQDAAETAARAAADALLAPIASPTFTGVPAAPTAAVGTNTTQVATTAFVQAGRSWTRVLKTADQTVTSSATLVNDTALKFAMAANTAYIFRFVIFQYIGGGGSKFAVNGPTGLSYLRVASLNNTPSTAYETSILPLWPAGIEQHASYTGYIENGATGGDLVLRFAQTGSHATSLVVQKGSYLEYTAIS